jgi:hypothetical protein
MGELESLLIERGAEDIPHPGGTLLKHLRRTSERLQSWGANDELQALGLGHATYGTDGFGTVLLDVADRDRLRAVAGDAVEAQIYRYASCGRKATYPRLGERPHVLFTDRFTGNRMLLPADELRPFAELTAANELDVALHVPSLSKPHRQWLLGLVTLLRDLLTPAAWQDVTTALTAAA